MQTKVFSKICLNQKNKNRIQNIFGSNNIQMKSNLMDDPMDEFPTPVPIIPKERYNQSVNPVIPG